MSPLCSTLLHCARPFWLAGLLVGTVCAADKKTGASSYPDGAPSDWSHPGAPLIKLATEGWIFVKLPRPGYEPVATSANGVVMLRNIQSGAYWRWRHGELTPLLPDGSLSRNTALFGKPLPPASAPSGEFHMLANYFINSSGVIAMGFHYSKWQQGFLRFGRRDDQYIKVWSPADSKGRLVQGHERTESIFDAGWLVSLAERYSRLVAVTSQGDVFGEFSRLPPADPVGSIPFLAYYRYPRDAPSIVQASWLGLDLVLVAASETGSYIGRRVAADGNTVAGVVDNQNVDFAPIYINQNGIVLGRSGLANFSDPIDTTGANVMFSKTAGKIPLPTDGRVTWLDEQDRPNGYDAPAGGHPVVWIARRKVNGELLSPISYDRIPYAPLPMPTGWTSNHKIAPDTAKPQVGTMFNPATNQSQPFLAIRGGLRVDANRDGQIALDGSDATSAASPFRFWVNDDIDRLHTFKDSAADSMADITETEEDDIGPAEAQQKLWNADGWTNNKADSKRDLEDFARLQLYTGGLNDSFKSGQLFLGLKWADVTGDPGIRIYKHLDSAGGLGYLTDDATATTQMAEYAIRDARFQNDSPSSSLNAMVHGTQTFVLPSSLFANLSDASPKTHLLFEGVKNGKGQLKLVILKQDGTTYTEIGEGPGVWMELKKIGDMYEHWSVGNASGGAPDTIAARVPALSGSGSAFKYDNGTPSPEEQKYILFVHGWNMEQWEKERFAETAYKRLWWQGYKGRFGLFSWPCTNRFDETSTLGKIIEGVSDGTHFDRGEWTAWRSGTPLRQLLQSLNGGYGGQLYVFSHSMGGIVMSEALRLQSDAGGGQIANVYVASQAALSAHLYDGTLSTAVGSASSVQWEYNHPSLPTGSRNYGPQTTNVYRNWLAYLLNGSATSSKAVGTLVNFYNQNDWALAAPVWQFNQITKPDWPDVFHSQPYQYGYTGDPAFFADAFTRQSGEIIYPLALGTRSGPQDRYEIMAFAAESHVKSFGATPNVSQGVTRSFNVRSIWLADSGDHKAHIWHSAQFRSTMPKQKDYWKTLLGRQGFDITTGVLP